ncbi:MAG: NUDIX hydrolase [Nitriliruptorales bacterium]
MPRGERPVLVVGAVARDGDDRLLVIQRGIAPGKGLWTIPGGRVEHGEPLSVAVVRETREETGLDVEVVGVVGVVEIVDEGFHLVSIDHEVRVVGGELVAGDDAAAVAWMSRSELEVVETTDGLLEFLDEHGFDLAP